MVDAAWQWAAIDAPILVRLIAALLLWSGVTWCLLGRDLRIRSLHAIAAGLLLVTAFAVMAALYDTSWDGMSYHLPAVLSLAEGWNPMHGVSTVVPANWYANGIWTLRAALFGLLGTIEGSKIVNAMLLLGALFTLCPALAALLQRPLGPRELCAAYVMVGNPVAVSQLFTSLVDGAVYETGLTVIAAILLAGTSYRRSALCILSAAIILLTGAKITGVYYGIALPLVALIAFRRRIAGTRVIAATIAVSLALATIFVGYRPYITDLRDHAQFAELMRIGMIARPDSPARLADLSPPLALLYSLLARTSGVEDDVELKPSLFVSPHELKIAATPDPVAGGFGPFFSAELVASTAAAVLAFRRHVQGLLALAVGLTAVSAILPAAQFARLVPFMWMVPLSATVASTSAPGRLARMLCIAVVVLALGNTALAFGGNLARTILGDWRARVLESDLSARHQEILLVPLPGRYFERTVGFRLQQARIPYRVARADECKSYVRRERIAYCLGD